MDLVGKTYKDFGFTKDEILEWMNPDVKEKYLADEGKPMNDLLLTINAGAMLEEEKQNFTTTTYGIDPYNPAGGICFKEGEDPRLGYEKRYHSSESPKDKYGFVIEEVYPPEVITRMREIRSWQEEHTVYKVWEAVHNYMTPRSHLYMGEALADIYGFSTVDGYVNWLYEISFRTDRNEVECRNLYFYLKGDRRLYDTMILWKNRAKMRLDFSKLQRIAEVDGVKFSKVEAYKTLSKKYGISVRKLSPWISKTQSVFTRMKNKAIKEMDNLCKTSKKGGEKAVEERKEDINQRVQEIQKQKRMPSAPNVLKYLAKIKDENVKIAEIKKVIEYAKLNGIL